jgi:hypothetical protein
LIGARHRGRLLKISETRCAATLWMPTPLGGPYDHRARNRPDLTCGAACVPSPEPVNWQPISQMPLVAGMIDGALGDTREHIQTRPW